MAKARIIRRKAAIRPSALTKGLKKLYFKSRRLDSKRPAKAPGWRKVGNRKKAYYEHRVNRSDRSRKARL